jgi:signal transduction histidine kinase
MRERAALIGGEIEIVSRPRDGTRVVIRVPARAVAEPVAQ